MASSLAPVVAAAASSVSLSSPGNMTATAVWEAIGKDDGANVAADKSKSINECSQPEQHGNVLFVSSSCKDLSRANLIANRPQCDNSRAELDETVKLMYGPKEFRKMQAAKRRCAEATKRRCAEVENLAEWAVRGAHPVARSSLAEVEAVARAMRSVPGARSSFSATNPITMARLEETEAVARAMRFGIVSEPERDAMDVLDPDGEARAAK